MALGEAQVVWNLQAGRPGPLLVKGLHLSVVGAAAGFGPVEGAVSGGVDCTSSLS